METKGNAALCRVAFLVIAPIAALIDAAAAFGCRTGAHRHENDMHAGNRPSPLFIQLV